MADTPERERPRILDVGIGDPEAPANAIPNIIAHLVETETWRNSATVLTACLLIGLGYWSYHGVRDSIAETQAVGLQALLGTVATGLDVWVNDQRTQTERLAKQPWVEAPAARLAAAVAASPDPELVKRLCQSPDAAQLSTGLRALAGTRGAAGAKIVDRTGLVLASAHPENCGRRLRSPLFRVKLDQALDGTPQFVRPHQDLELSLEGSSGRRRPVAWIVAPIRDGKGAATTALALGAFSDGDFASVFSAARPGSTTEAYAFGDDGLMLTPTRFAESLTAAGMLPESESPPSAFAIPVRDPGGDVAAGHAPALEPAARPLTQSAALASAARGKSQDSERQGTLVEPYRSYRGDDVIGAWRWLPAYDIGIIAEISATEAFAGLRYLLISFALIGTFVIISLGAALTSGFSLSRLQRQFGKLQRLGAYTLENKISEGGMATIYLAHHALLKRPTAVKVLKKHVATNEFVHRFEREVQVASQLLHPNTVRIYDFGRTREGLPYYVMEYLDGVTLAELVDTTGPVPPGRVLHIMRQVGAALREAHEHGMIHRDVKPENVMLCRRGEDDIVKLLDFGLVKSFETTAMIDVTKQVDLLGTPRYMAPERLLNPAGADPRSDIYALGAVGYYLLTGKPIFDGNDNQEIGNQILHSPAPRAALSATVPEGLDELIAACLEKDRERRPQTMSALIAVLDRLSSRLAWTHEDAAAWWASHRERGAAKAPEGT